VLQVHRVAVERTPLNFQSPTPNSRFLTFGSSVGGWQLHSGPLCRLERGSGARCDDRTTGWRARRAKKDAAEL